MLRALTLLLPSAVPASNMGSISPPARAKRPIAPSDQFVRFGTAHPCSVFREDPVLAQLGLTPSLATEADLPEIQTLGTVCSIEMSPIIHGVFKGMPHTVDTPPSADQSPSDDTLTTRTMGLAEVLGLFKVAASASGKQRMYFETPNSHMIVLKNRDQKIVAFEGVVPLKTMPESYLHGFGAPLDRKCCLLADLYVTPNYRNQGVGKALKKTALAYARDHLDYRYAFAVTRIGESSHRANVQLGYRPVSANTAFPGAPGMTRDAVSELIAENNMGTLALTYLDLTSPAAREALR